jgi:nicotinamidase-related amidase
MLSRRDTPSNSEERAAGCSRARWANHFVHPDGAAFPFWRAMKGSTTGNRTFIVEGSWGALIVDELKPAPGDHLVVKKGFGGFANTPLDTILRDPRRGHVRGCGCHDVCLRLHDDPSARGIQLSNDDRQ